MIRRPPRSTLDRSSAASDVYKRQLDDLGRHVGVETEGIFQLAYGDDDADATGEAEDAVSYTHLRAHETVLDLVCRLLLEKKKNLRSTEVHVEELQTRVGLIRYTGL